MPTANSTQIKKKMNKIVPIMAIRFVLEFHFLKVTSMAETTKKRRIPMKRKSKKDQSTSDVNCIAMSGIHNRSTAIPNIQK